MQGECCSTLSRFCRCIRQEAEMRFDSLGHLVLSFSVFAGKFIVIPFLESIELRACGAEVPITLKVLGD